MIDARKVELLPLLDREMKGFIEHISPGVTAVQVERLTTQIEAYPDLQRLVRIPLFLALLVATQRPGEPLPSRRSELIEAYLKTLFHPEEHKAAPRLRDAGRLREALQGLAFDLLTKDKIGALERTVERFLKGHAGDGISVEELLDDAKTSGILRREAGSRLNFPFPIVQEYLWEASAVLRRLDAKQISQADIEAAAMDETLPTGVRLSCLGHCSRADEALMMRLAVEALQEPRASDQWSALHALKAAASPEARLAELLRRDDLDDGAHTTIIEHLDDCLGDVPRSIAFLRNQFDREDLGPDLRLEARVWAAMGSIMLRRSSWWRDSARSRDILKPCLDRRNEPGRHGWR